MKVAFPIEAVLTVVTGRLLCDFDDLYEILRYLCRDQSVSIAMVPDAVDHCRPYVLAQYPDLAQFMGLDIPAGQIDAFLDRAGDTFGHTLLLAPAQDWTPRDPIQDMVDRMGADRVIAIVTPSDDA